MIFRKVIDAVVALAFCMSVDFGGRATYDFFKKETVKVLKRGTK